MAEASQATTIFVAEKQTPAAKRMALSFMINMLSQSCVVKQTTNTAINYFPRGLIVLPKF
jgi:hypothetical protein